MLLTLLLWAQSIPSDQQVHLPYSLKGTPSLFQARLAILYRPRSPSLTAPVIHSAIHRLILWLGITPRISSVEVFLEMGRCLLHRPQLALQVQEVQVESRIQRMSRTCMQIHLCSIAGMRLYQVPRPVQGGRSRRKTSKQQRRRWPRHTIPFLTNMPSSNSSNMNMIVHRTDSPFQDTSVRPFHPTPPPNTNNSTNSIHIITTNSTNSSSSSNIPGGARRFRPYPPSDLAYRLITTIGGAPAQRN